jgi:hypothetical protein
VSSNLTLFDEPVEPRRPRDEVRIKDIRVQPGPDGRRVAIWIELTPFIDKPNLDIVLLRDGEEVRSLAIVAAMQHQMQVTMHLPAHDPYGSYEARVDLTYDDQVYQSETYAFEVGVAAP